MGQLPEGLLLLADSICSFQPVYGQGMTVAALEVETLDKLLTHRLSGQQTIEFGQRSSGSSNNGTLTSSHAAGNSSEAVQLAGLAAEFQAAVLPIVRSSWDLAVGNDMQFAGAVSTDGPAAAGLGAKFQAAYMAALFDLATSDPVVSLCAALRPCLHSCDTQLLPLPSHSYVAVYYVHSCGYDCSSAAATFCHGLHCLRVLERRAQHGSKYTVRTANTTLVLTVLVITVLNQYSFWPLARLLPRHTATIRVKHQGPANTAVCVTV